MADSSLPEDTLSFVKECILAGRVLWSYHVNMRLRERRITRDMILEAVESLEIIERYPDDKYFPSILLRGVAENAVFHFVAGLDVPGKTVRIVTAYRPDPDQWDKEFRVRSRQP